MQLQFSIFFLNYLLVQLQFKTVSELFTYAAAVFFLPESILHKYSVEGYLKITCSFWEVVCHMITFLRQESLATPLRESKSPRKSRFRWFLKVFLPLPVSQHVRLRQVVAIVEVPLDTLRQQFESQVRIIWMCMLDFAGWSRFCGVHRSQYYRYLKTRWASKTV